MLANTNIIYHHTGCHIDGQKNQIVIDDTSYALFPNATPPKNH